MSAKKANLEKGNAAVAEGNYEGFLSLCADDMEWTFIDDKNLQGQEAVRQYMAATYLEPPNFTTDNLIAEGDFVTAVGDIIATGEDGKTTHYSYCDVWRFHEGKMVELKAFVVEKADGKQESGSA